MIINVFTLIQLLSYRLRDSTHFFKVSSVSLNDLHSQVDCCQLKHLRQPFFYSVIRARRRKDVCQILNVYLVILLEI